MTESDYLAKTGAAVKAYLNTLNAIAGSLAEACPEVGEPYEHRIKRLRTRLAFDPTPEAIEESSHVVGRELEDYAERASLVSDRRNPALRQRLSMLEKLIQSTSARNDYYGNRQTYLASQIETCEWPDTPERFAAFQARQAALLRQCIESWTRENASLLTAMRDQLVAIDAKLAGETAVDPVTGLINYEEANRRIEGFKTAGTDFTLISFEILGPATGEVLRQVAIRLSSQFRAQDLTARWGDREFLVIFQGQPEIAEARVGYVAPWVTGSYQREDGEWVEITVKAYLHFSELAAA